jgi:hypothetical protein
VALMFNLRSVFVPALLATSLMTAAACGAGSPSPPGNTASSTTTAGSTAAMPAACQAYLNSVQMCLDHVTAQNPSAVAQVRDILDVNRASIERLSHQGPPDEYCVSANNAWQSRKSSFGC